jgi:hypothetical protein
MKEPFRWPASTYEYIRLEAELIEVLQEIDEKKCFRELGYTSLFEYATKALNLSESTAYGFIAVARKAKEVPRLQEAIKKNELTVSRARRITSVVTNENAFDFILKAQTLTQRELEKEVVRANPKAAVIERSRYVTPERLELKLGASEDLLMKLRRAQDIESQRAGRHCSLEETIAAALGIYLERKDPVEKAKRHFSKDPRKGRRISQESATVGQSLGSSLVLSDSGVQEHFELNVDSVVHGDTGIRRDSAVQSAFGVLDDFAGARTSHSELRPSDQLSSRRVPTPPWERKPLAAAMKHKIQRRDGGQCTFVTPEGERCKNQRWVHLHHLNPVRRGGSNSLENIVTLCAAHHQMTHLRDFRPGKNEKRH